MIDRDATFTLICFGLVSSALGSVINKSSSLYIEGFQFIGTCSYIFSQS
jgi:hypothetical protein